MAIAVKTDSFVSPALTQQSIYDGLKAAFSNAGYPAPIDEFSSGTDKVIVYAAVLDATKTYGTSYLRIRITTTLIIAQQLFSTWTISTHVGTNGSTEIVFSAYAANVTLNFIALNGGSEHKLVLAYQGANYVQLGFISPEFRPSWWDLNAWNYCFLPTTNAFTVLRSTALNPLANIENTVATASSALMANPNPYTNRRDILPGLVVLSAANNGITGRTSDDWILVYATGLTKFDIIQIPADTKQYLLLAPGAGGVAVRIS